jgi:glutamine amidotransferase-like uncharacterized protein
MNKSQIHYFTVIPEEHSISFLHYVIISWEVENQSYRFDVEIVSSRDLYRGKLTNERYDMLLYTPDVVDIKINQGVSRFQLRNMIERAAIQRFVKNSGGFFGVCAGAVVAGGVPKDASTLKRHLFKSLDLGISEVYWLS